MFSCSEKETHLKEDNLKGNVTEVSEILYKADALQNGYNEQTKAYQGHLFKKYNTNGNRTCVQVMGKGGVVLHSKIFDYNDAQLCTEIETYDYLYNGEHEYRGKYIFEYKGQKKQTLLKIDSNNDTIDIHTFSYKVADKIVENVTNFVTKNKFTYENSYENGRLVQQVIKDSTGHITNQMLWQNNAYGDNIKYTNSVPSSDKTQIDSFAYEYDAVKNWVKKYRFNSDGTLLNITKRHIVYNNHKDGFVKSTEMVMGVGLLMLFFLILILCRLYKRYNLSKNATL